MIQIGQEIYVQLFFKNILEFQDLFIFSSKIQMERVQVQNKRQMATVAPWKTTIATIQTRVSTKTNLQNIHQVKNLLLLRWTIFILLKGKGVGGIPKCLLLFTGVGGWF